MKLIDSHCHLFLPEFNTDRDEVIQRGIKSKVEKFVLPNVDSSTITDLLDLVFSYPSYCFPLLGLHPSSVEEDYNSDLEKLKTYLERNKFYGIGEIGLDFYWDRTFEKEQILAFRTQLEWAAELNLPAIIHIRESFDETFEVIEELGRNELTGIFHCFTGTLEQAKRAIDLGFYLGLGGILTFKNAGLDKVVREIPLEHLVLETDSPYLAPAPRRGKRNEPAFLPYIANKLAEIKDLDVHKIAEQTSLNAARIFKF